ncbi:mannitol dehydrogenase family protein [Pelagibius sp. Alg239-R121]|uniref:mannitol dehydrogenase family protein n=1 Tax=Pelagibius sp. Alg239-R121 TaxID=2993448 RepID=UPI0024A7989A|nr:mannitol dehydrogenase family protein [Pelagibius sp. Alg239-R121]
MTRLSAITRTELPSSVARPSFDRSTTGVGIIHLGIGAFHRAHEAVYTDDVLTHSGGDWAICGVSLRQRTVQDQMDPQDGLYCVVERDGDGDRCRVIDAVTETLFAPDDPPALVARMAAPATKIVSLTVTEKGYCHDPASGKLNLEDPGIVRDLNNPDRPSTAIGFLAAALNIRRLAGEKPFTVMTCDNLPHNGRMLASLVAAYAAELESAFSDWIRSEVAFPCTMVDRIVPATTDEELDALAQRLGMRDEAAVICEPFRQWVIEDNFAMGRPAWEEAGAQMVKDVGPFEDMKLRLLNGSHSMLAYLGFLAGYETIAETMAEPAFERLVRRYMNDEATPSLSLPPGVDLDSYKDQLVARFKNPALKHRTWQIAMDGSQKLPQRLLSVVRSRLEQGGSFELAALAVAGWMRYVTGEDEKGRIIDVRDPLADRLGAISREAKGDLSRMAASYLAVGEVFGDDLPEADDFRVAVFAALSGLYSSGAKRSVQEAVTL